jgi:hypothetical protein
VGTQAAVVRSAKEVDDFAYNVIEFTYGKKS